MAFAISVKASDLTSGRLKDYWAKFSQFESEPSMMALDYPPHITLAAYDEISERQLSETLTSVFGSRSAITLRFGEVRYFDTPEFVVWAAPAGSEALLHAQAAIHELINPSHCREHFRPANWIPHLTLATRVTPANKAAAIDLASQLREPFDVVFDKADCVEFYPVRIIDECYLPTAS